MEMYVSIFWGAMFWFGYVLTASRQTLPIEIPKPRCLESLFAIFFFVLSFPFVLRRCFLTYLVFWQCLLQMLKIISDEHPRDVRHFEKNAYKNIFHHLTLAYIKTKTNQKQFHMAA